MYKILTHISRWIHKPKLIRAKRNLSVEKHSYQNGNLKVRGKTKVHIGSYCAFGKNISIMSENHDKRFISMQGLFYKSMFGTPHPGNQIFPNPFKTKGPITIGSDVWIGDNSLILSGVTIGHGAIVAAGSIVTRNVSPYSIVAGSPAKEIKMRYKSEIISSLLSIKWWEWTVEKIRDNQKLFYADLSKITPQDLKELINE